MEFIDKMAAVANPKWVLFGVIVMSSALLAVMELRRRRAADAGDGQRDWIVAIIDKNGALVMHEDGLMTEEDARVTVRLLANKLDTPAHALRLDVESCWRISMAEYRDTVESAPAKAPRKRSARKSRASVSV